MSDRFPLEPLLKESAAAQILGVCERTLRKERQAGRLPFVMVRGSIRYSPDDLRAYIERSRQCPIPNAQRPRRSRGAPDRPAVFDFEEALMASGRRKPRESGA